MLKPLFLILFCWLASPLAAAADIRISPLRLVLTPQAPRAEFEISNPSRRIVDGRASWIDLQATETGYAPASGEARASVSAAPYLVVSPAHFRLKPGDRATVTVRIRDGATPPRGERRSHLLIEADAARSPIRKAGGGLPVDAALGVSAPVLLRNGGEARAALEDVKLLRDADGLLMLSVDIIPKGSLSSYGRIVARFSPDGAAGGATDIVQAAATSAMTLGMRRNVNGFTDAPRRRIEIPLGRTTLGRGRLTVAYEGEGEFSGRVFDRRSYDIEPPTQ